MSNGLDCRIESSQCIIRQITTFLQNILTSFFFKSLFHASNLNSWWKLNTWNNGRTKEETKIFRRNSMISQIVFWLDSICGNHECRLYLNLSKFLLIIVLRITVWDRVPKEDAANFESATFLWFTYVVNMSRIATFLGRFWIFG